MTDKVQQVVGATAVGIGGGGTILNRLTEWEPIVDLFLTYGNAVLLVGGMILMFGTFAHRWARRKRRHDRQSDD